MKLATIIVGGRPTVAEVMPEEGRYRVLRDAAGEPLSNMMDVIAGGASTKLNGNGADTGDLAWVTMAAPLLPPRNVICVGKNYRDHAQEFHNSGFDSSAHVNGNAVPEFPIVFTKAPGSIIADGQTIRYPHGVSDSIDYEAELGVVIGKGGRGISKANALDHVFGYTIVNDVTARDLQARHAQWFIGKSLDSFCPMGPWLVTRDEVDAGNLDLKCWVNGELRQSANTKDLIFDIPTLIETLSAGITLLPGDIIATGTPAGVGIGFNPPKYLQPGDEIAIEIGGLGRLSNRMSP